MTRAAIDWALIGKAVDFYESARFKYVEVPWIVSDEAVNATLPEGARPMRVAFGGERSLVGSAEQSFLQMMLYDKLEPGSYVAASPCFRDDVVDEWHFKDFLKVELIMVVDQPAPREYARSLAMEAAVFFRKVGGAESQHLRLVETAIGLDLEYGGVEIGSYGVRSNRGHHWVCGTGLAEPRFSQALTRVNCR